jgi:hypothetical protein
MSLIVLLDSGPLGLVTNPKEGAESLACKEWLTRLTRDGHQALVPAITDYEVRRELKLHGKANGLRNLDTLAASAGYLALTPQALWLAADLWAQARQAGLPTADRFALDADVILAAQARTLDAGFWEMPGAAVVIATSNVGHLSRLADARLWQDVS